MPALVEQRHTEVICKLLARHGVQEPDGRPLHAYGITDDEMRVMQRVLRTRVQIDDRSRRTAEIFTLWASEHIRREFRGGPLRWTLIFETLGASERV